MLRPADARAYASKSITCLERGIQPSGPAEVCWLGDDLRLSYTALERFCWTNLSSLDIDLLLLAGLIAYADRNSRRSRNEPRVLNLELPVHQVDFWDRDEVRIRLSDTLLFSTGDFWSFSFRPRQQADEQALQLRFNAPDIGESIVLPYSGGLDSFAELKLLPSRHPGKTPLLVTTVHNRSLTKLTKATTESRAQGRLRVPVEFSTQGHPEPTFRSRTFLFFTVAAVAAKLSGSQIILISENGQGSIGPSLIPSGGEHPFQSSHPGFTYRLTRFLSILWGKNSPTFLHPNQWLTKGQVLKQVADLEGLDGWQNTRSCSLAMKRYKGSEAPFHCGICSGCLLRRLALFASGVTQLHIEEPYFWKDLRAPSLAESVDPYLRSLTRPTSANDEQIAAAAVVDHKSLAAIQDLPTEASPIRRAVRELATSTGGQLEETQTKLDALLLQHRTEWEAFVRSLGPDSWVAKLAEASLWAS